MKKSLRTLLTGILAFTMIFAMSAPMSMAAQESLPHEGIQLNFVDFHCCDEKQVATQVDFENFFTMYIDCIKMELFGEIEEMRLDMLVAVDRVVEPISVNDNLISDDLVNFEKSIESLSSGCPACGSSTGYRWDRRTTHFRCSEHHGCTVVVTYSVLFVVCNWMQCGVTISFDYTIESQNCFFLTR